MIPSTTRNPSPAATRTGRWAAALPNDPGLDEILADPTLSSTAKALVTVMVRNWARFKDHLWPCDRTLAAKVGKSVGQVQRCLHELEQAGRISREKTDDVPNGRRIWLLWRSPGGREGAQRETAPARTVLAAPARSKQVVIVNEGIEPEIRSDSRPRPEDAPTPTAVSDSTAPLMVPSPVDGSITPPVPSPGPQEPRCTPSASGMRELTALHLQAHTKAAGGRSSDPAQSPAPVPLAGPLAVLDLGTTTRPGTPAAPSVAPRPPRINAPASSTPSSPVRATNATRRMGLGLTLDEMVALVEKTGDPIIAAELARRKAPSPPYEPAPETLPTADLLGRLPGRHDLIMAVARRLSVETGDFKEASLRTFETMAEAVALRTVPAPVLVDCWHQAMGPKAGHNGKVLVAAWKRGQAIHQRC